jgi:hypothetical protein
MKFLVEVLSDAQAEAFKASDFVDADAAEPKLVMAIAHDGVTAALSVLQSPAFDEIPENSLVRISKLSN